MKRKRKAQDHLLLQVGIFCVIFFGAALAINAYYIFEYQVDLAIHMANRSCENVEKKVVQEMEAFEMLPWLLEYWETHYDSIDLKYLERGVDWDDYEAYCMEYQKIFQKYKSREKIPAEAITAMKPEHQHYFATDELIIWTSKMSEAEKMIPYGNLTCAFKTKDGRYFRAICGESGHDRIASYNDKGLTFFDKSQGPVADYYYGDSEVKSIKDLPQDYDITELNGEKKENMLFYSTVYQPIIQDGKTVAVMALEMAWTKEDFMDVMSMTGAVEVRNALCMVIAMAGLLILLYFFAVKPVLVLQKNVRSYTEDKDAEKISRKLSEIRSGNEIGRLKDDMIRLANEMEEYAGELVSVTAEKERIGAELDVAAQIQNGILPKIYPGIPAFEDRDDFSIFASIHPAKEVGGDLFDFFLIDEDHLALVIGDVSGKGVPAALFMAITTTLIRHELQGGNRRITEVLSTVNNCLCEGNDNMMFVTIWVAVLNLSTGEMVSANGGHDYPMIKSAGGGFELLEEESGIPLGVMENGEYMENTYRLNPGDTVYVYTDGVAEAMNTQDEQFDFGRMLAVLNDHPEDSPEELDAVMHEAVAEFVGDAEQFDDMTMLCVKINQR